MEAQTSVPAEEGQRAKREPVRHQVEPGKGWQLVDWKELWRYRDLFEFLVRRDVRVLYKQTILGFGWAVLRPFFSMIVFTIVFGGMAGVPSDGAPYAVFALAALVPWTYFSSALSEASQSLVANRNMLTKVYFPRLVIPLTPVLAKLVDFGIACGLLAATMLWYGVAPTGYVLLMPLFVLLMAFTAAGAGMWLSALAVQYRDVRFALRFALQLLMYAAPVVWPASLIERSFGEAMYVAYGLYPMAGVIEGFRAVLLGTRAIPWSLLGMGALSAGVLFLSGAFYFRQVERTFADVA